MSARDGSSTRATRRSEHFFARSIAPHSPASAVAVLRVEWYRRFMPAGSGALVEFFFAPGSRYSYLAASQMPGLEREFQCVVDWRPVHGPALRALRGADPFAGAPVSGQYEWPYRRRDAERWAAHYGIRFREPPSHDVDFALLARAATAATRLDRAGAYGWAIASAVYGSDTWPLDERVCIDVAVAVGLDAPRFEAALRDPATQAVLDATAAEAHRRGVFGVPTFLVGDQLFWGNDRLVLLRDHLRARSG